MSTLREQLKKISNDNLVSFDKLLDTEFDEEIDYNNLDEKIELKQKSDSYYNIFTKKESEVVPQTSDIEKTSNTMLCLLNYYNDRFFNFECDMRNDMLDVKREIKNANEKLITLRYAIICFIIPIVVSYVINIISKLL